MRYSTWKLELVSDILRMVVGMKKQVNESMNCTTNKKLYWLTKDNTNCIKEILCFQMRNFFFKSNINCLTNLEKKSVLSGKWFQLKVGQI